MIINNIRTYIHLLIPFVSLLAFGQQDEIEFYRNECFDEKIRTIRIHKLGWELSEPMISLNAEESLILHFDELDSEFANYQYRILHCNADWTQSSLNEMEYLDGFNDLYFEYHEASFGTQQDYIHYEAVFPNEDQKFVKSGNYAIVVYPEGDYENPLFIRQFGVAENGISIQPNIKHPAEVELRDYMQEFDFNLIFNPSEISNPTENVIVQINQNNRPDLQLNSMKPKFVRENVLIYEEDDINLFEAGNEFRNLDLTTLNSRTPQVYKWDIEKDTVHAHVLIDQKRQFKQYIQYGDIDGRYVIRNIQSDEPHLESQYVLCHFELDYGYKISGGDVYLFGSLSDNQYQEQFKMKFDEQSKTYQLKAYLKQGYYNYSYIFVGGSRIDMETIEGSHFETKNEYIVKAYYRDPFNFYDRLMMYEVLKSRP